MPGCTSQRIVQGRNRSLAVPAPQEFLSHDRKGFVYANFCN
jgi:hypothetical protein